MIIIIDTNLGNKLTGASIQDIRDQLYLALLETNLLSYNPENLTIINDRNIENKVYQAVDKVLEDESFVSD